jgi:broad specificity phosphatase PhoE
MDEPPAPTDRRLYIVRHGQTERSARMVYSGQADIPLTATGRRQAAAAGALLEASGIDLIVSSPLERARDTAAAIAQAAGLTVQVDDRLTEVDYGPFEGLDRPQARERFGAAFQAWREDPFGAPVPGMEPLGEALDRARSATADVLRGGARPVIVGHQGILRLVLIALGEIAPNQYFKTRIEEASPMAIDGAAVAPPPQSSAPLGT